MERVQVLHGAPGAWLDYDTIGSRRRRRIILCSGDYDVRPRTCCRWPGFAHRFRRFDLVPFSGNSVVVLWKLCLSFVVVKIRGYLFFSVRDLGVCLSLICVVHYP